MTLSNFYLICFVVGFSFCMLSFVTSAFHWHLPTNWHLPTVAHGSPAGSHVGSGHVAPAAHGAAHTAGTTSTQTRASARVSWLNPPAFMAFLAWFGGAGYLATHYYHLWLMLGLGVAVGSGFVGAAIVSWFLVRVLLPHETELHDADYELVGQIAKVNIPIRVGGTGEIVFSQDGVRRCAGARSDDGGAIEKGAEVVIARMDRGLAYVTTWEKWSK
jgi:membrane protein implicated in regulation of membrane protease activity